MEVRNRVLQTAHTKLFSVDGVDSARDLDYQVARARGGVGLLVTGNRIVDPSAAAGFGFPRGHLASAVASDRRITDAVHRHGARIVAQLNHFGVQAPTDAADDPRVTIGPSAVTSPAFTDVARPMDAEAIASNAQAWARSAALARESGFDGVEISAVHGYLLHQFLSPIYNKRTDAYGGDLDGRSRLLHEVVAAVREAVGGDFTVGVRLVLTDGIEGALTIDDAAAVGRRLRDEGHVDYLNVSAGGYHNLFLSSAPPDLPDGWLVEDVGRLKAAVGELPVFAVGGLKDPRQAEEILARGQADMVAMTRAQIADPELVAKISEGREDELRHCIRGNQGCIGRFFRGLPISCTVNPAAGRERKFAHALDPVGTPADWVVVGGGPAGMKAAETLAARGHRVVLFEREDELGGQVRLLLRTPGRGEFAWLVRDLERRLDALGVDVRLGTAAGPEDVLAAAADPHVIVATGALPDPTGFTIVEPLRAAIPGADLPHVCSGWDVLERSDLPGGPVVMVDADGSRYAAGVAEVLLDAGHEVEVVTRFSSLLPGTLTTLEQGILYRRLFEKGLTFTANAWVDEITPDAVTVKNLYTGRLRRIDDVALVVLTTPSRAQDGLHDALDGRATSVLRIGDCLAPRRIDHAIYEGFTAGAEMFDERAIQEGELEAWPA
jgi:2,4-dienoyl-CoA reductase-like NADH-dependent reductase (Old Yellow Enzyme family)/thioredoxin reductase